MNATKTFQPNDTLMLEVGTQECFVGQLVFQNASGTRLELDNVRNWHTDKPLHGVQIFYLNEIRSVRLLPNSTSDSNYNADGAANSSEDSTSPSVKQAPLPIEAPPSPHIETTDKTTYVDQLQRIQAACMAPPPLEAPSSPPIDTTDKTTSVLSVDQLQRIQAACMAPVYHTQADHRYLTTIRQLQQQDTVALSVACVFLATHSTIGLLALMGAHHDGIIHLFDVVSMGGIPVELRHLLAARRPRKIVHDSSRAAYVLQRVYNVTLDGVFDTRMAHWVVSAETGMCRLSALVQIYLHIPDGSVPDAGAINWTKRPLSVEQRLLAGRQVAYLPALYEHLLFERMIGQFYADCKRFAHAYACGLDEMDEAFHVITVDDVKPDVESQPQVLRKDLPSFPPLEKLEI